MAVGRARRCRKGVVMEPVCKLADISGFPTWVIDGKNYEGDQTFEQLAEASGFKQ
jgi:protein-disulfide isomerase